MRKISFFSLAAAGLMLSIATVAPAKAEMVVLGDSQLDAVTAGHTVTRTVNAGASQSGSCTGPCTFVSGGTYAYSGIVNGESFFGSGLSGSLEGGGGRVNAVIYGSDTVQVGNHPPMVKKSYFGTFDGSVFDSSLFWRVDGAS